MLDLSQKHYKSTYTEPGKVSSTIVIDNGTYELRAGYLGRPSIITKNHIFKYKDRISLDSFPQSTLKSMFDDDVIVNFDVLEATLDLILNHLSPPSSLKHLVFTATPHAPTESLIIELLFKKYTFKSIQIVPDYLCVYQHYFPRRNNVLIVSLGYSSVIVSYVEGGREVEVFKNTFGIKELLEYIKHCMLVRYQNYRRDYSRLIEYLRVSQNYNQEAVEIFESMRSGNSEKNLVISDLSYTQYNETTKKVKKSLQQSPIQIPELDYDLLKCEDKDLEADELKEKRKQRMIYFGTLNRLKVRANERLAELSSRLSMLKNEIEKKRDPVKYLQTKKAKFQELLRKIELREKFKQDLRNKKSREFQVKMKEGPLDPSEQCIKQKVIEAEDESIGKKLQDELDSIASEISSLDPNFQPFHLNTVDILLGNDSECVNIDLIKWAEVFFDPSIIGSEQMGLSEIFENISSLYNVKDVLICGGMCQMKGLRERCQRELDSLSKNGPVSIIISEDPQLDPFYGAKGLDWYPIYSRNDFQKYGAKELIYMKKQ